MFICKDCMIRHSWKPGSTFPYDHAGDCDLCWDKDVNVFLIDRPEKIANVDSTFSELVGKRLDKAEDLEYNRLCDSLFVYFERGPRTGQIDYGTTESLLYQINVLVNGTPDWKATYKRRLRAKHSYITWLEINGG